jgi:hypothetical protein
MDIGKGNEVEQREEQGTIVQLKDENGELQFYPEGAERKDQKPVTVTVVGTYSKTFRKARKDQRDKNLKRGRVGLKAQETEVIAKCILGWEGLTFNGQDFRYTDENKVLLLGVPWIREQIEEAMGDHQGFSTARSQS